MNTITVTTQAELDAAIAASPDRIEIRGNGEFFVRGHTTVCAAYADATVYAYDNSKVYAYADATTVYASDTVVVRASDTVVVRASDTVVVRASDTVVVRASDTVVVRAYGNSKVYAHANSKVYAHANSKVYAYGNSKVYAYADATVYAYADATVYAYDNSKVYAYDNSKVYAYADATTVRASDTVVVRASDTVVVRAYGNSKVVDARTPRGWAQFNDLAVVDGTVTLYKALEDDLVSGKDYIPTTWPTSGTLTATDWDPEPRCGGGLHLSPTIEAARSYRPGAPRYLKCTAVLDDIVPISTDKCKVATVIVVEEVSREGEVVS